MLASLAVISPCVASFALVSSDLLRDDFLSSTVGNWCLPHLTNTLDSPATPPQLRMSVNDPSSWAPPGESSTDLWEERSNFNGLVLSCVAYGVHFTLYLIVLQHLLKHPTHRVGSGGKAKISWGLVLYITWNFILGTFGLAGGARFNQLTFIDARNYPGGPNAFVAAQYGDFVNIFGTVALVILQWFADGMVVSVADHQC